MAIPSKIPDDAPADASIERMTREEGERLLDRQARKFLDMSGKEFARRYREGSIDEPHRLDVTRVAILLPLIES